MADTCPGFQLYPPLQTIPELELWHSLIQAVCTLFHSRVESAANRIVIDRSPTIFLPIDGLYFRRLECNGYSTRDPIISSIEKMSRFNFGNRIHPLSVDLFTEGEVTKTKDDFEQECLRQLSLPMNPLYDNIHCALCLIEVRVEDIVRCNRCHKRTYCSEECRAIDWDSGQTHNRWCAADICEEGIDWEVRSLPGKGLGVIAKLSIPNLRRIMVDPVRTIRERVVRDLEPIGGTTLEKERLNSFGAGAEGQSVLCVRVARMNHDCNSNACHTFEEGSGVMVVVANRDIEPGEEICINYTNFNGRLGGHNPESARNLLFDKWKIRCTDSCGCREEARVAMLRQARQLDSEICEMLKTRNPMGCIPKIDLLIDLLDRTGATWTWRQHTLWTGFRLSIMQEDTIHRAKDYGRLALRLQESIFHFDSERTREMRRYIQDPTKHKCYLLKLAAKSA